MRNKQTCGSWLEYATSQLKKLDIGSAELDALVLLEYVLHQDRAHILAHLDNPLTYKQFVQLQKALKQRLKHVPLAYIRGFIEFYGRKFTVSKYVLIPRSESESFIDLLKPLINKQKLQTLLDVGTGSGILAITAKLEMPNLNVCASDISNKALSIARKNSKNLKANVSFFKDNLISNSNKPYDFILANLPYVPVNYGVSASIKYEPCRALYSGKDGLDLTKKFLPLAYKSLNKDGYLLLESLPKQQTTIKKLCQKTGLKFVAKDSLVQCFQRPQNVFFLNSSVYCLLSNYLEIILKLLGLFFLHHFVSK